MAEDFDDITIDDIDIDKLESDDGDKSKRLLFIIAFVLITAGGAGYYFFMNDTADATMADGDSEDDEDEGLSTPYYFSFDPAFVVNFMGKGRAKFLQVNIAGLTRDPAVKEDITMHFPHIRNNIVLLLSSKSYDELITPEGKELLRKEILVEVKKIIEKETGKEGIEDIFFTNFVMQ